jgi:Fic family protein
MEGAVPDRIANLAGDVIAAGAAFGANLHPKTAASLANLVRIMKAYYSNLIEGHNTRPADIVRALEGKLSGTAEQRDLQIEAASHVRVQKSIDHLVVTAELPEPASINFVLHLHHGFYEGATRAALTMTNAKQTYIMTPGSFRSKPIHDVAVGRSGFSPYAPIRSPSWHRFLT